VHPVSPRLRLPPAFAGQITAYAIGSLKARQFSSSSPGVSVKLIARFRGQRRVIFGRRRTGWRSHLRSASGTAPARKRDRKRLFAAGPAIWNARGIMSRQCPFRQKCRNFDFSMQQD
jgi:hypothetical protein